MKDRLDKIRKILLKKKQIDVTSLSDRLDVSEVTIRRDLDKLEKEDFLKKTYGGAILNENNIESNELIRLFDNKNDPLGEERESIAEVVMNLVNNGEAIYLGSGPTSLAIARYLKKNNSRLTVFTNDLLVASELFNLSQISLVLAGGEMLSSYPAMAGLLAQQVVENFFLQKAFIEVRGVDLDYGYSLNSLIEVEFVKKMLDNCKESFIVADYSLFDEVAFSPLGGISRFQKVVSNIKIPSKYKEFYFKEDITLYNSCDFS